MTRPRSARTTAQRMHALVAANRSIVSGLSLSGVLRRIVEAARDVGEAQYAALGVRAPDGSLDQFLHVGMDAATIRAIGPMPSGQGLLGALLTESRAIRLAQLGQDPRSAGFPAAHPPMTSFLGVPVRTRDTVFGHLYLTDRLGGVPFTQEDEELVLALAATAGTAIENARLHEQERSRHQWLQAAAAVDRALLSTDVAGVEVLGDIARSVQRLASADVVVIVVPGTATPDELEVVVAVGSSAALLIGLRSLRARSLAGQAMDAGRALRSDPDADHLDHQLRAVVPLLQQMALPMSGDAGVRGAVVAGRTSTRPFDDVELELAATFAARAAIALELADARSVQHRVSLLEEREQIAHELHDQVIQRLFATGLTMQSVVMELPAGDLRERTSTAVENLDATIRRVQSTIAALKDPAR